MRNHRLRKVLQIERDVVPCGVYHQLELVWPDRFQLKSTRCARAPSCAPHPHACACRFLAHTCVEWHTTER